MESTTPKPQFAGATEAEINDVLSEPEINRPLAEELMRILDVYAANCAEYVQKFGIVPDSFMDEIPPTALERKALSMIREVADEQEKEDGPGGEDEEAR